MDEQTYTNEEIEAVIRRYALLYYRDRIDNENPLSPIETDEGEQ